MRKTLAIGCMVLAALMFGIQPLAIAADSAQGLAKSITIKGSDTMVHLVTAWAEAFMKANTGMEVSVTGGGSGTGIAAMLNKTTDICSASREISAKEKEQAAQNGLHPQESVVARDGIVIVVNPKNPVNELTLDQLKNIFTGASTKWSDVGGGEGDFIVLSRESSSGTYVFFQEHVLKKEDYTPRARLMPATSAIVQSVSEDETAIGYVGLGYAAAAKGKVKILQIKTDANATAVVPSEDTVRNGSYPIARPLYLYTGEPASGTVKQFIDACLGEPGQKIVREEGYVTVK